METVGIDASIQDAAQAVLESRCRTIFVTDKELALLGSVTEGDLVRAFLRGLNPKASVRHVMNSNPLFFDESASLEDVKFLMSRGGHLAIPIVDSQRKLIKVIKQSEV